MAVCFHIQFLFPGSASDRRMTNPMFLQKRFLRFPKEEQQVNCNAFFLHCGKNMKQSLQYQLHSARSDFPMKSDLPSQFCLLFWVYAGRLYFHKHPLYIRRDTVSAHRRMFLNLLYPGNVLPREWHIFDSWDRYLWSQLLARTVNSAGSIPF